MSNKKKCKRCTFSDSPSWYNNKQRAKYETDRHYLLKRNSFDNKVLQRVDSAINSRLI